MFGSFPGKQDLCSRMRKQQHSVVWTSRARYDRGSLSFSFHHATSARPTDASSLSAHPLSNPNSHSYILPVSPMPTDVISYYGSTNTVSHAVGTHNECRRFRILKACHIHRRLSSAYVLSDKSSNALSCLSLWDPVAGAVIDGTEQATCPLQASGLNDR